MNAILCDVTYKLQIILKKSVFYTEFQRRENVGNFLNNRYFKTENIILVLKYKPRKLKLSKMNIASKFLYFKLIKE